VTSTRGTFQVIAPFHFGKAGPNIFSIPAINQIAKGGDSSWAPDEKLNAAGIARYVWFFLLGHPHFARRRTDGTRKHPISIHESHPQRSI
jgi:hypothetical protein